MTDTDYIATGNRLRVRVASILLCLVLVATLVIAAIPMPRDGVLSDLVGITLCTAMLTPAWWLSTGGRLKGQPMAAGIAGLLLIAPFVPVALLWTGLGTPWDATPADNRMRYAVLALGSCSMTLAFLSAERLARPVGNGFLGLFVQVSALLAGSAYLLWCSFQWGYHAMIDDSGVTSEPAGVINNLLDAQLFVAGALTYCSALALAWLLYRGGWLARWTCVLHLVIGSVLLSLLALRGVHFPAPDAGPSPWYVEPGFIAGVPAMPWVLAFFMGAAVLRRAAHGVRSAGRQTPGTNA
jgi:hypothetical protein